MAYECAHYFFTDYINVKCTSQDKSDARILSFKILRIVIAVM